MRAGRLTSSGPEQFWSLLFLEHGGVLAAGMYAQIWFLLTCVQLRQLCICEWQVWLPSWRSFRSAAGLKSPGSEALH
jgi:hypothetical protein